MNIGNIQGIMTKLHKMPWEHRKMRQFWLTMLKKSSRKTAIWVGLHMMCRNGSNSILEGENFVSKGRKLEKCTPQTIQCGWSIKGRAWEVMEDKGYTGNMKLNYNLNHFYPLPIEQTWIIYLIILSLSFPIFKWG